MDRAVISVALGPSPYEELHLDLSISSLIAYEVLQQRLPLSNAPLKYSEHVNPRRILSCRSYAMLYIVAQSFPSATRSRYAHITCLRDTFLFPWQQLYNDDRPDLYWRSGRCQNRHAVASGDISAWDLPFAACIITPCRFDVAELFERVHTQLEEDAVFEDGQAPK